jgi:hypothetical protein
MVSFDFSIAVISLVQGKPESMSPTLRSVNVSLRSDWPEGGPTKFARALPGEIQKFKKCASFAPTKGLYGLSPFDALTLAQGGPGVSAHKR